MNKLADKKAEGSDLAPARLPLLLLVVSLIASGVPIVYAQMPGVGEIVLTPTHAAPGTLVSFQGVGWYLPSSWNYGYGPPLGRDLVCLVNGEPVKIDSHAICNVLTPSGIPEGEPVGTFVVGDVPAGDYSIFIDIEPRPGGAWLSGEATFTVDPVAIVTSVVMATAVTSVTPRTSMLTTSVSPASVLTVTATATTTKTESISIPQQPDYTTVLSIVAILVVIILALVVLRRRKKPSS